MSQILLECSRRWRKRSKAWKNIKKRQFIVLNPTDVELDLQETTSWTLNMLSIPQCCIWKPWLIWMDKQTMQTKCTIHGDRRNFQDKDFQLSAHQHLGEGLALKHNNIFQISNLEISVRQKLAKRSEKVWNHLSKIIITRNTTYMNVHLFR